MKETKSAPTSAISHIPSKSPSTARTSDQPAT
jgi:hypothetical protein